MNHLLVEQIIQDMNNLLAESRWGNQKAVMESRKAFRKAVEEIRKPLWKAERHWGKWQFWGLVSTPNLLPRARMDLLCWSQVLTIQN
jgi:hypothetical protein